MGSTSKQTKSISYLTESAVSGAGTNFSSAFDVSAYTTLDIYVNVTSTAGTSPALTVSYQTGSVETDVAYTVTDFASIGATGKYIYQVTQIGQWGRLKYVLGGTSPVFGVGIGAIAKT